MQLPCLPRSFTPQETMQKQVDTRMHESADRAGEEAGELRAAERQRQGGRHRRAEMARPVSPSGLSDRRPGWPWPARAPGWQAQDGRSSPSGRDVSRARWTNGKLSFCTVGTTTMASTAVPPNAELAGRCCTEIESMSTRVAARRVQNSTHARSTRGRTTTI